MWHTVELTVAGGIHHFYDACETLTDKNGDFTIQGQGLRIMSNLEPMDVYIFKAGYSYTEEGWDSLRMGLNPEERIKWEGDNPIFSIRKLTLDEMRNLHADKELIPDNKQWLLIKELNKAYKALGYTPYPEGN